MESEPANADLLEVARRVVWFKPPHEALRNRVLFLNHAMTYGDVQDVLAVRRSLDDEALRDALRKAHPGIFAPRSWACRHTVLGMVPVPPMPVRRHSPRQGERRVAGPAPGPRPGRFPQAIDQRSPAFHDGVMTVPRGLSRNCARARLASSAPSGRVHSSLLVVAGPCARPFFQSGVPDLRESRICRFPRQSRHGSQDRSGGHCTSRSLLPDIRAKRCSGPDFRLTVQAVRPIDLPSGRITSEAALAAWYGSKSAIGLSQAIVSMCPLHHTYLETHPGGGAIMKRKPPAQRSIGIDLHCRSDRRVPLRPRREAGPRPLPPVPVRVRLRRPRAGLLRPALRAVDAEVGALGRDLTRRIWGRHAAAGGRDVAPVAGRAFGSAFLLGSTRISGVKHLPALRNVSSNLVA